jgi:hypothetical protein
MSQPYFDTRRLRVHQFCISPKPEIEEHLLFVAFELDENAWEQPVVTVVVRQKLLDLPAYVKWVETAEGSRRQGYANEVLRAIEERIGFLAMTAGTDAGRGFIEQYREPEQPMPRWLLEPVY